MGLMGGKLHLVLYSAWINLMQELCTSLMISRICGSSGSGCVNQLGMLSRQSLIRQAQNLGMASSHSKISKSTTCFICSFLLVYHTAMKSWALFDGSTNCYHMFHCYFSYFQTENPLPPLAERGLHRAILPHQPGAPGDRTLLIGMCKVPSKCVLFHTFSTHQMCIKYIKSSRPTYKYVQDVSLDVSMHQGGPTSFRSFRIQLVGQSVSSQSKKITFRRCGKATARGRTKRDLKTAAAVSKWSRDGKRTSIVWSWSLGLLRLTSQKSQHHSASNLGVKRVIWIHLEFQVAILWCLNYEARKTCKISSSSDWTCLRSAGRVLVLDNLLGGDTSWTPEFATPMPRQPSGMQWCDWKSQRRHHPFQAYESAERARWIHAQLLLLGERLLESMSYAAHMGISLWNLLPPM